MSKTPEKSHDALEEFEAHHFQLCKPQNLQLERKTIKMQCRVVGRAKLEWDAVRCAPLHSQPVSAFAALQTANFPQSGNSSRSSHTTTITYGLIALPQTSAYTDMWHLTSPGPTTLLPLYFSPDRVSDTSWS